MCFKGKTLQIIRSSLGNHFKFAWSTEHHIYIFFSGSIYSCFLLQHLTHCSYFVLVLFTRVGLCGRAMLHDKYKPDLQMQNIEIEATGIEAMVALHPQCHMYSKSVFFKFWRVFYNLYLKPHLQSF